MLFSKGIGLGFNTFMTAAERRGIKPSPRIKGKAGGETLEILKRSGISGDRRPETLDTGEFTRLAGALEAFCGT
jgi:hypothetical protein